MSLRFRRASSVSFPVLCLLALEGRASLVWPQGTAAPTNQVPGQPAPTVRPRMREHFTRGAEIRDAVIRADLEAVRAPARWLAEHPQEDLPLSAQPNIAEMQRLAAEVAAASDLVQASRGMAQLAAACGSCHTASTRRRRSWPRCREARTKPLRPHAEALPCRRPSLPRVGRSVDALVECRSRRVDRRSVELELTRESTPIPRLRRWRSDSTTWRSRRAKPRTQVPFGPVRADARNLLRMPQAAERGDRAGRARLTIPDCR